MVREDAVCRRLMTVPGVGPLVAMTYKSAIDDPSRITKSKAAGALFGLTPKKYQSGEKDINGAITRTGDEMMRTALYEASTRYDRTQNFELYGHAERICLPVGITTKSDLVFARPRPKRKDSGSASPVTRAPVAQ